MANARGPAAGTLSTTGGQQQSLVRGPGADPRVVATCYFPRIRTLRPPRRAP